MDDEYAHMYLEEFKKKYPDIKVYETSTLEHKGLDEVLYAALAEIDKAREVEMELLKVQKRLLYIVMNLRNQTLRL